MSDQANTDDLDAQIKLYKDAMKEASGFKRRELEVRVDEAEKERQSRIDAANISADASRYGSDQSLAGTKYSSDNSLKGTQYSAASSAASSRYGTDADLYKFDAEQPLKRGDQALSFLTQYENLASHPASFLQASNYARLGHQVEGMPGMMADLLGNINPNGQPVGGNVAFRTGTGVMPQNAAMATFGADPLNLGTRAAAPAAPVWYGPQGQGGSYNPGTMSAAFTGYDPSYGTGDHRGAIVADSTYGAQGGMAPTYTAPRGVATEAGTDGQYANTYASSPYAIQGLTQSQPMVMNDGRLVADYDPSEDQFKAGASQILQNGAQKLGNQALERLTGTERDMLASGIADQGGIPADFIEAYNRSRIDNSSTGRAL